MTNDEQGGAWEWAVQGPFNPRYDASTTPTGLRYACEIQGPFCGYDSHGSQTWEQFLTLGPPDDVEMPSSIAEEIRIYALAHAK